jgi:hypothetical protein
VWSGGLPGQSSFSYVTAISLACDEKSSDNLDRVMKRALGVYWDKGYI